MTCVYVYIWSMRPRDIKKWAEKTLRLAWLPASSILIDCSCYLSSSTSRKHVFVSSQETGWSQLDHSGVKESKACQAGERLSVHCSSLSYAFVHQKGDYSLNPALCHSQFCFSKSTNMSVVMDEEMIFTYCMWYFITIKCDLCGAAAVMPEKHI